MNGWEICLGVYSGILIGVYSDAYEDGYKFCIYLPFIFIEINTYYD